MTHPSPAEVEEMIARCEAAAHDERLSSGTLYLDAVTMLRRQLAPTVPLLDGMHKARDIAGHITRQFMVGAEHYGASRVCDALDDAIEEMSAAPQQPPAPTVGEALRAAPPLWLDPPAPTVPLPRAEKAEAVLAERDAEIARLSRGLNQREDALTKMALIFQPLHLGHDLVSEHGMVQSAQALADRVAERDAEIARLTGRMCLICGRPEPCKETPEACTFDPDPITAARSFLERAHKAEADARRYHWIETNVWRAMDLMKTMPIKGPIYAKLRAAIDAALAKERI
jgi:hypothetical protein